MTKRVLNIDADEAAQGVFAAAKDMHLDGDIAQTSTLVSVATSRARVFLTSPRRASPSPTRSLSLHFDDTTESDAAESGEEQENPMRGLTDSGEEDGCFMLSDPSAPAGRPPGDRHRKRQRHSSPRFPVHGEFVTGRVEPLVLGPMPNAPRLGIRLRPTPLAELQVQPRWARVREEEHTVGVYGTPRRISATHCTSGAMTDRNKHELPQCLYFDETFRSDWATRRHRELPLRMVVSPRFAEWLMGVPRGWSSTQPIDSADRKRHFVFSKTLFLRRHRHPTISLFSGCGALDLALLPWCAPIAYCDICPAAVDVLKARMNDGSLPNGPVFCDARHLTKVALERQVPGLQTTHRGGQVGAPGVFAGTLGEAQGRMGCAVEGVGLVFGFPCTDISKAGLRAGLDGRQSSLVFEALRIGDELDVKWMFVENVDGMTTSGSDERLVDAVIKRGFRCRWVVLSASNGGSPQRRKRWFMLAWRRGFVPSMLMPDQGSMLRDHIQTELGLNFNGGRPTPPTDWMTEVDTYKVTKPSLELLGNSVVPVQAMLAASILAHPWQ